jgi:hypothetical protein
MGCTYLRCYARLAEGIGEDAVGLEVDQAMFKGHKEIRQ